MSKQHEKESRPGEPLQRHIPTASAVLEDGALVELVYDPKARRTEWRALRAFEAV
jgi:hypothetical protein